MAQLSQEIAAARARYEELFVEHGRLSLVMVQECANSHFCDRHGGGKIGTCGSKRPERLSRKTWAALAALCFVVLRLRRLNCSRMFWVGVGAWLAATMPSSERTGNGMLDQLLNCFLAGFAAASSKSSTRALALPRHAEKEACCGVELQGHDPKNQIEGPAFSKTSTGVRTVTDRHEPGWSSSNSLAIELDLKLTDLRLLVDRRLKPLEVELPGVRLGIWQLTGRLASQAEQIRQQLQRIEALEHAMETWQRTDVGKVAKVTSTLAGAGEPCSSMAANEALTQVLALQIEDLDLHTFCRRGSQVDIM